MKKCNTAPTSEIRTPEKIWCKTKKQFKYPGACKKNNLSCCAAYLEWEQREGEKVNA